jgi:mRNA interferase RelE/StbE
MISRPVEPSADSASPTASQPGFQLAFKPSALKEWRALDGSLKAQFKTVLLRRLEQPRLPAAALHGMPDCYKIKLRSSGYRLVYQVEDDIVTVTVVAVGKREGNAVYRKAGERL